MTLRTYHLIIVVLLGMFALSAGNYFLDWGFFGDAAKVVMSGATFVLILVMALMPAEVDQEMQAEHEDRVEKGC